MAINPIPFNRALVSIADEYGERLVDELKFQIAEKDKFATGNLADSMYHEVKSADGKVLIAVIAADYFRFVDRGRRPGAKMPPAAPINKWLRVKGLPLRLSFVIRRSIAKKGIKGIFILNPTIKKINAEFLPKYEKQMANLVGVSMVNDIFSETNTRGQMIPKNLR